MRRFILGAALAAASAWPAMSSAGDKQVSQQIAEALKQSGRLVNYNVGVTYEEGTVYLKGRVTSAEQMNEAVALTQSLPGVHDVVNQLEVGNGPAVRAAVAPTAGNEVQHAMFPEPSGEAPSSQQGSESMLTGLVDRFETALAPKDAKQPTRNTSRARSQTPIGTPTQIQQTAGQQMMPNMHPGQMAGPMPGPMPGQPGPGQAMPAGMHPGAQMASMPCAPGMAPGMGPPPGAYGGYNGPRPAYFPGAGGGVAPVSYDQPTMPNYAWPSYAAYPNYAALTYPRQYSATAWPYIGPFYPYPQVPLGWRKVTLEWDDGWWFLDFRAKHKHH